MPATYLTGDALATLATLPANSFDAMLCDPPYHLTTGKKGGSGPASVTLDNPYGRARVTAGFMGMTWDGGDVAHNPAVWREALRVLKPGAFALVACGTRTQHRMVTALEDAGFEIRDVIAWLYGSGFPKSHDVSKGIDRAAGAERPVIGPNPAARPGDAGTGVAGETATTSSGWRKPVRPDKTGAATPDAERWQGYGTALKPAIELWTLVRKPPEGTVAANVLRHGTGALNIDGCRVPTDWAADRGESWLRSGKQTVPDDTWQGPSAKAQGSTVADRVNTLGRWPANVIHDGSDEVLAGFPESTDGVAVKRNGVTHGGRIAFGGIGKHPPGTPDVGFGGSGSAARFFYTAKSSRHERMAGLGHIETIVVSSSTWDGEEHEARLQVDTAPSPPRVIGAFGTPNSDVAEWNTFLFGSGITEASQQGCRFTISTATPSTTPSPTLRSLTQRHTSAFTLAASSEVDAGTSPAPSAANSSPSTPSIGTSPARGGRSTDGADPATSPEWWARNARVRLRSEGAKGSTHPTHKPLALTTYLARLLLPPERADGMPRRIVTPFSGVGSEVIGALLAGWDEATGIELDPAYASIARARTAHWLAHPHDLEDADEAPVAPASFGPLFDG